MSQNYPRLPIEKFGRLLIESGDLDPIYIALAKSVTPSLRHRWLIAYWCFYHAGFACYASEQVDFWGALMTAARNETPAPTGGRWPRGSERRHFRAAQAIRPIGELIERFPGHQGPSEVIKMITNVCRPPGGAPAGDIIRNVKTLRGFGDWISFKVADMCETNLGIPVSFDNATIFMFETPVKGARAAVSAWQDRALAEGDENMTRRLDSLVALGQDMPLCTYAVNRLTRVFADLSAAPRYDRPIALQEIETVLCKWKSHLGGHYPPGKDSHEIREGLVEWGPHSVLARSFIAALPVWDPAKLETA